MVSGVEVDVKIYLDNWIYVGLQSAAIHNNQKIVNYLNE